MSTPKTNLSVLAPASAYQPDSLLSFNHHNREILRITVDGRIVTGEGLSADEATREAAKLLIASFEEQIQKMVETRIAAERAEADLAAERARNAGLLPLLARWLKMADDCHHEQQEVGYSEYNVTAGLMCDTRAAIDEAMKEASK